MRWNYDWKRFLVVEENLSRENAMHIRVISLEK